MTTIKITTLTILSMLMIGLVAYGAWSFERYVNYNLSYKALMEQTVREMVKEEALR